MPDNLISIIVPVYNTEQYLDRCLESIVNQTYNNIEIIIADDGSPDNSPQICDEWAERDRRIRVLHLKNNGVACARNAALRQAAGDYIAFVDSDDYIEPDMYEKLLSAITENDADIAVCNYQINDESRGEEKTSTLSAGDALKLIAQGDYKYGVLWDKLFKKSVVDGIEMPSLKCSQDLPYNYFAMKNAKVVAENSLKLYHYFQNDSSTMHRKFGKSNFDAVKARKIILEDIDSDDLQPYAVKGYILSCFVFIDGIIKNNKCRELYSGVRAEILKYRKYIISSSVFSKKDKLKITLFWLLPKLYNKIVDIRN